MAKINEETVNNFKEILDQEFKTYSYSGRGMYGKKCLAFDVSRHASILGVVAQIMYDFDDEFGDADLSDLVSIFEGSRQDSMGMDSVVYFPSIEWNDEWTDGRDSDDEDDEDSENDDNE